MTRLIRIAAAAIMLAFTFQLMADSRKVLKIAITASGKITADGRPTTIEALILILRELAKNKGEVWYYREAPEAEPHPNAMKVLSAIVDQNLPVRLSSKPDYSDSIDDKGRSVPHQ
jgi:biopolymer transport protein ExbD